MSDTKKTCDKALATAVVALSAAVLFRTATQKNSQLQPAEAPQQKSHKEEKLLDMPITLYSDKSVITKHEDEISRKYRNAMLITTIMSFVLIAFVIWLQTKYSLFSDNTANTTEFSNSSAGDNTNRYRGMATFLFIEVYGIALAIVMNIIVLAIMVIYDAIKRTAKEANSTDKK